MVFVCQDRNISFSDKCKYFRIEFGMERFINVILNSVIVRYERAQLFALLDVFNFFKHINEL
jgi:hypothetical protein